MLTPYQFASNTPIQAVDLDGKEGVINTIKVDGKPILTVVSLKVLIAVTNNTATATTQTANNKTARPYDVGSSYQNEQVLLNDITLMLNSTYYNQGKQMADVMTNPNTVNGNIPVYFNFEVSTFRVENKSISAMRNEMIDNPNYTFDDPRKLDAYDNQQFTNFQIVGQNTIGGTTTGNTWAYTSTIDINHFNLRNQSLEAFKDAESTVRHEIGHKLLARHSNFSVRNPTATDHNLKLGGIFRYSTKITFNGNPTITVLPTSEHVTQLNTDFILQGSLKQKDINIPKAQ